MTTSDLIPPYADPEEHQETVPFIRSSLFKLIVVLGVFLAGAGIVVGMLRSQEVPVEEVEVEATPTPVAEYSQEDVKQADIALANQSGATQEAEKKLREQEKKRRDQQRQKAKKAAKKKKTALATTVSPQPTPAAALRPAPRRSRPAAPVRPVPAVVPQGGRSPQPISRSPQPIPSKSQKPVRSVPVVTPLPPPGRPGGGLEQVEFHTLEDHKALSQLGSWGGVPQSVRESQAQVGLPLLVLEPAQEFEATLITPIAWTNNAPPAGQYLARIEEGDYRGARVMMTAAADDAGLLTLVPIYWLDVRGQRQGLGGMQVLASGGKPLIARRKKRGAGGFGKDVLQALTNVGGAIAGSDRVQTTIVNSASDLVQGESESTSRDVIWFVKAGQKIKLIALGGKE